MLPDTGKLLSLGRMWVLCSRECQTAFHLPEGVHDGPRLIVSRANRGYDLHQGMKTSIPKRAHACEISMV